MTDQELARRARWEGGVEIQLGVIGKDISSIKESMNKLVSKEDCVNRHGTLTQQMKDSHKQLNGKMDTALSALGAQVNGVSNAVDNTQRTLQQAETERAADSATHRTRWETIVLVLSAIAMLGSALINYLNRTNIQVPPPIQVVQKPDVSSSPATSLSGGSQGTRPSLPASSK